MRRAAVIVFVAPPGQVKRGLAWELRQVGDSGLWDKTLILVPPLPAEGLRARWQAFQAACGDIWPFTRPLPAAEAGTLVLTFRNDAWTAIRARRDEWAYSAAIKEALSVLPAA